MVPCYPRHPAPSVAGTPANEQSFAWPILLPPVSLCQIPAATSGRKAPIPLSKLLIRIEQSLVHAPPLGWYGRCHASFERMTTLVSVVARDIRFPTSVEHDGSDALNPEPDYSATYVTVTTSGGEEGHGLTFTCGRGNELTVAAVSSYEPLVVGTSLDEFRDNPGAFWRRLTGDGQLRWLGPEKGVVHPATAAIINAIWDLVAKLEGKPLWQLLSDMSPEEVVRCIDFRHITDALNQDEALAILQNGSAGRQAREVELRQR